MEQFKKRLSGRIVLMAIASIIIGGIYALLFFDIIGLLTRPASYGGLAPAYFWLLKYSCWFIFLNIRHRLIMNSC